MFHNFRLLDENPTAWSPMRDYVNATAGVYVTSQAAVSGAAGPNVDPTSVGFSAGKWVGKVSSRWDYVPGANDLDTAELLAGRINAILALGPAQMVTVDEVTLQTVGWCATALPLVSDPSRVYWYLVGGANTSWDALDADLTQPFVTTALQSGHGLLPELWITQSAAERTGDVRAYIQSQYRGPGDGKLPYLLERAKAVGAPASRIVPVLTPVARFYKRRTGGGPIRLPWGRFVDLMFQELVTSFPKVSANGIGTWVWDSPRLLPPSESVGGRLGEGALVLSPATMFATLLRYYSTGEGATSEGRKRYFKSIG